MASLAQLITDRLQPGSLRHRLVAGAFWSTAASAAGQVFVFVSTVICGRLLGPGDYGRFALVVSTVMLFSTVAALGLGVTATRYVAEHRQADPERAGRIIGLSSLSACGAGLAIAIFLLAGAPWLERTFLKSPELVIDLRIGAILMFFTSYNTHQLGALAGFEAFKALTTANFARGIITLLLIAGGAALGGLHGSILGYAAASGVTCVLFAAVLGNQCRRHRVRIRYAVRTEEWKLLYRFSIPVVIAGLSFTPAVWFSNALLARSAGYEQLGVFNAAMQWQLIILFLANAVGNTGLPLLSSALPDRDMARYKRLLLWIFAATTGSALAVAIPVAVGAPFIMQLFGRGFQHADAAVRLLCLAAVLSAMNFVVGYAIWSLDATVSGMLLALMRGAALIGFTYLFAGSGATGLATAYVSMAIVQTLVQLVFMRWLLTSRSAAWEKIRTVPEPSGLAECTTD